MGAEGVERIVQTGYVFGVSFGSQSKQLDFPYPIRTQMITGRCTVT